MTLRLVSLALRTTSKSWSTCTPSPAPWGNTRGVTFEGKVVYEDQEVPIPSAAIDGAFIENLSQLIRRVASSTPARKVPSQMECGFCNLTAADCPERAAGDAMQEGETEDF